LVANAVPAADYERTLLAIDFDEASRFAIQSVKGMEFLRRSRMTAIHLFDTPAAGLMRRAMERSDAIAEYTAHEALNAGARFGRFLSAAGLLRVEHLLRPQEGPPGRALALRAQLHDADLFVVGTNQRTGVQRMVLGSVAKDVVTSAKCDVLVIPAVTKPGLPVRPNVRLSPRGAKLPLAAIV
jgi:nucleotide-binding universal stress UspA family protein